MDRHSRGVRGATRWMGRQREGSAASIDLFWLPLGAGGWFVRLNGRIYEAVHAFLERRRPRELYHSAHEVPVPEGRFVIENAWPIPDTDGASRGVVVSVCFATRSGGGRTG
ncbi:MAG: hypothetical protein M3256_04175 [Actinomycetota bacterium]|nr:hypothetical protein [Actinomycetota bacterium]